MASADKRTPKKVTAVLSDDGRVFECPFNGTGDWQAVHFILDDHFHALVKRSDLT